jgi:hypothetical protein
VSSRLRAPLQRLIDATKSREIPGWIRPAGEDGSGTIRRGTSMTRSQCCPGSTSTDVSANSEHSSRFVASHQMGR